MGCRCEIMRFFSRSYARRSTPGYSRVPSQKEHKTVARGEVELLERRKNYLTSITFQSCSLAFSLAFF